MKSINDTQSKENVGEQLVDAETLRNMTLTQEELFNIAKENTCTSFMMSMVDAATKRGQKFYQAQVLAAADKTLIDEVAKVFTDLKYTVTLSDIVQGQANQDVRIMTISWE